MSFRDTCTWNTTLSITVVPYKQIISVINNNISTCFQGALLLTEVLKERDAQIEMKNSKLDADKIREEHLLRLQQRVMIPSLTKNLLPDKFIMCYTYM